MNVMLENCPADWPSVCEVVHHPLVKSGHGRIFVMEYKVGQTPEWAQGQAFETTAVQSIHEAESQGEKFQNWIWGGT
jgi:hypothetical protein